MRRTLFSQAILIVVLHVTAGAAFGQFAWIDANGVRQYSDQPPPASVPKKNILKSPANGPREAASGAAVAAGAAVTDAAAGDKSAAGKAPASIAEKNADFVRRQTEQAEKEKRAADEAKNAAMKAKNCDSAQTYARSLASGERIATLDKNGERSYLSDEKRARELADAQNIVKGCK